MGATEGSRSAGSQGDAIKTVVSLPGTARAGPGGGDIVAWGSAPHETKFYIDGVELPALFHGSGIRSVVPSEWIGTLSFVPGGFGVERGRGIGGVVDVSSRDRPLDVARVVAHADLLDAGALVALPLTSYASAEAAFRWGYVERWLGQLRGADVGSLLNVPSYRDWQLRARISPAERTWQLDTVWLGSRDASDRSIPSSDRAKRVRATSELGFDRVYLRYRHMRFNERTELTPFFGVDTVARSAQADGAGWRQDTVTWHYGLRGAWQREHPAGHSFRLGLDALGSLSSLEREGTLTLPAREGDPQVFGQLPNDDTAFDRYSTHLLDVAPYAEAQFRFGATQINPGLRADTYLIETDRSRPRTGSVPPVGHSRALVAFEPRLALAHDLGVTRFFTAAGIYHQAPAAEDQSAVFGNPKLLLARALHVSAGERVALAANLSLEVLGYYKWSDRLTARSPLPVPNTAESLVSEGRGRSFGTQLLLRQASTGGWSGWLTWTVSKSERRDPGAPAWRAFDYDQPHVVALLVSRVLGAWSLGLRYRYASGSPRTRVIGASYDLRSDRYEPLLGARGGQRLPVFYQLDLRVDRRWSLGDANLSVYLDALNVTFRANAEEIAYSADYTEQAYLTGIPPLLLIGARFER